MNEEMPTSENIYGAERSCSKCGARLNYKNPTGECNYHSISKDEQIEGTSELYARSPRAAGLKGIGNQDRGVIKLPHKPQ